MTNIAKFLCMSFWLCAAACGNPSQEPVSTLDTDTVKEALANEGKLNLELQQWTRKPASYTISEDTITITKEYDKKVVSNQTYVMIPITALTTNDLYNLLLTV